VFLQSFLESLGSAVALDLLDAADLLDLLIVSPDSELLTYQMRTAVLALGCCNFVLPTVLLVALSLGRYGRDDDNILKRIRVLHRVFLFALVCVTPFIRLILITISRSTQPPIPPG